MTTEDPTTEPTSAEPGKRGHPPDGWHEVALGVIAKTRNISAACKAAGVDWSTYYAHLERDPAFKVAHDEAMWSVVEKVESAAVKSALNGSDRQQQFLLKAWRPDVYNVPARTQISGPNDGPIQIDAAGT